MTFVLKVFHKVFSLTMTVSIVKSVLAGHRVGHNKLFMLIEAGQNDAERRHRDSHFIRYSDCFS